MLLGERGTHAELVCTEITRLFGIDLFLHVYVNRHTLVWLNTYRLRLRVRVRVNRLGL